MMGQRLVSTRLVLVAWVLGGWVTAGLLPRAWMLSSVAQEMPVLSAAQKTELAEADRLNHQVVQLYQQGQYAAAIPLAEKALVIREHVLGKDHPDVAQSLNNLAGLYQTEGRYTEAEPLYRRSLQIYEIHLGKDNPNVANSLNNLAELYRLQGRYAEAEPLYRRSLQIYEIRLGKDNPDVADSLNNLATLYQAQGHYAEAEPLYRRSLQIYETRLGKDNPDVADSLNNLATLYRLQGRYAEAEPLYRRSLQIFETRLGKDHPDVATSLDNLAELYRLQGRYAEAEPLYRRSLQIFETRLGKDHPAVANSLNNLAELYRLQKHYLEAELLYRRSLQIFETRLGKDHPAVARSLNNLAALYQTQGRYQEAEALYRRSLQILETLLGKDHPDVATSLNNLATLYQSQGNTSRALTSLQQGLQVQEVNLAANLIIGSEQQKRDYIATISRATDEVISLNLQAASTNADAAHLALTTLLQRKGRILDAQTDNLTRLRQNLTPDLQTKLDQLARLDTQRSALYYSSLSRTNPEQYHVNLQALQQQTTDLEAELNRRSAEFRTTFQPVTLEAVQKQLPANTLLIELATYRPFNPKAKPDATWGKPHYAAYLLSPNGTLNALDLGETAPIDQLAAQLRRLLETPTIDPKPIARRLDAALLQPIRDLYRRSAGLSPSAPLPHLLISPDGYLNLIPFAALVDENNRYLAETTEISYLTSGRDLLRLASQPPSQQPSLILANPNYDRPGTAIPLPIAQTAHKPLATRAIDLSGLHFDPLPGTGTEAHAIALELPNAHLLTDTQASKTALQQAQSPRILHIATHGFFLQDLPEPDPNRSRSFLTLSSDRATALPYPEPTATQPNTTLGQNPLLRSGLALAGANLTQANRTNGILTALEASNLHLRGTQLVVLSACETGLGDIADGEGVYGLRRALTLAGAETEMMSLWKVSDEGTKDLMVKYYDKLRHGIGRSDALLQTQREFLQNPQYRHPYYWASFILSGDWHPLH